MSVAQGAAEDGTKPASRRELWLTLLLAGCTGLAPFAMQSVAPATPRIAEGFGVSQSAAQLFVSLSMLSAAVGAIVYGPAADRYGRRPVMLICLAGALGGAVLTAGAPTLGVALFGRVLQSIGAGAGMVLSRAVARDLYGRTGAATMISRITAAMVIAPMLAPLIGGVLADQFGWRAIFVAIAVLAAALWFWAHRSLQETLSAPTDRLDLASALASYRSLLRDPVFLSPALFTAASIAVFFTFVGGAPIVAEARFDMSATGYGVAFVVVAFGYLVGNLASPRFAAELGPDTAILLAGLGAILASGLGCLAYAAGAEGPVWLFAATFGISITSGLTQPQALAAAVSAAPDRAGAASSLASMLQFGTAAVAAQVASLLPADRPEALLALMTVLSALAALAFAAFGRAALRSSA